MNSQTRLEQVLCRNQEYAMVGGMGGTTEQLQAVLDAIAPEICATLTAEEILDHMKAVYGETVPYYAGLPEHRDINHSLITFMNLPQLADGSRVLDLGCGPTLRDSIFMACPDPGVRESKMNRVKREGVTIAVVPKKSFHVSAVDGSLDILRHAYFAGVTARGPVENRRMRARMHFYFHQSDMHDLSSLGKEKFDAVWSSASLLTHTPHALIKPAFQSVNSVLKRKGVFAVSYPARRDGQAYDDLRLSRSGTVKYFSHPTPTEVSTIAEELGFLGIGDEFNDYVNDKGAVKNFFVTQFFQKGK